MRQITVHLNYLHDIENPDGYKRAMENVQKILPIHHRRSVVLTRDYQISPDAFPQATSEHGMITSPSLDMASADISAESLDSPSSSTEKSKWDQIRAANSRTAQGSTWDALRQQHEKVRIKPNPQDRGDDKWISEKF